MAFSFGPFVLDAVAGRLLRDGVEVKMRPQAFAALRTLVTHVGRVVTHEQLITEAWGGTVVSRHTVNVTLGDVRRCLEDCGSWVVSVAKRGFSLRVPNYDTLVRMGWHFANIRSGEGFERAIECFSSAEEEAPHDLRALEGRGACYLLQASFGIRRGREMCDAFLDTYRRAQAIGTPTIDIRCNYAHAIHMYQRRCDEALDEFDRLTTEHPQFAMAHARRTLVLVTMGDLDRALESTVRAMATDPLHPISATVAVNVHLWRREFDAAVAFGSRAVEMHPYLLLIRVYYGMALEFGGRPTQALEQYHIASVMTHGSPWARGLEGSCLAQLGRVEAARQVLDDLVERQQREYIDTYALARLRLALGDREAAFTELARAIDDRVASLYALRYDPTADGFRSDSRFAALLDKNLSPLGKAASIVA